MPVEYKRNRAFGIKSLPNLPLVEKFYSKLAGKQSKNKLQLNFPIKEIYQIDIVQLYESKLFECTIEMRSSWDGPSWAQFYSHSVPLFIYWSLSLLFY
ncbi:conserved hypothetical protein [Trichinella spiralis]|uniref:hypothetical protein n=1 Tax=Trichinella spiralis TaxID=6334 RepID=UPI0001EFBE98|nr:conserved hypothetical protein [Trichinella spiralis]